MEKQTERRRSDRLMFSRSQDIMVKFSVSHSSDRTEVATVLNISRGGIFFTLRSGRAREYRQGDRLIYHEIRGRESHKFELNLPAKVVWIMNDPADGFSGVGTQFLEKDGEQQDKIQEFMTFFEKS